MTSANVSGILPQANVSLNPQNMKADPKEIGTGIGFADVMTKAMSDQTSGRISLQTDSMNPQSLADSTLTVDKTSLSSSSVKENISSVNEDQPAKPEELQETVDDFSESVNQVLEDSLDVTEEDVEAAMETLGLTAVDLLNPANVTKLISQLTDTTDSVTLLMNEDVTNAITTINELAMDVTESTGLSVPELTEILTPTVETEAPIPMEGIENAVEVPTTPELPAEDFDSFNPVETGKEPLNPEDGAKITVEDLRTPEKPLDAQPQQEAKAEEVAQSDSALTVALADETEEETSFTDGGEENQTFEREKVPETKFDPQAKESQISFTETISQPETTEAPVSEPLTSYAPDFEQTMDMIDQIAQQAKVTLSNDSTSMEMILNPEHLGKIYLEVTEDNGSVHAKLVAENPQVKEALEAQMAAVKDNLNQAGTKVTEVEVSVGTHEFEENLEKDAHSEEQQGQAEQQQQGQRRRNINLNNPDELSGLMTEEEQIVAQMMKDSGNTMNIEV